METVYLRGTSRQRSPGSSSGFPDTRTLRGRKTAQTEKASTTVSKVGKVAPRRLRASKVSGAKVAEAETTNLFHSPRRVQTDSILDRGRFQRESVRHVHTQHCHVSERPPSLTRAGLSGVCVSVSRTGGLSVSRTGSWCSGPG